MSTTEQDLPQARTAQQRFDDIYMTSSDIGRELGISRATLVQGRKRGMLPDPIVVNEGQIVLYERAIVRPYLDAWKLVLDIKKSKTT